MYSLLDNLGYGWVYWVLMVAYAFTILGIIVIVLSENRNPVKSLAWITVLLLFPGGGAILYMFFGRSIKNTHILSRRNKKRLRGLQLGSEVINIPKDLSSENRRQVQLARSLSGAGFYEGNSVEVFVNANDKLNALEEDLRNAKQYIHLQYYIFENDTSGQRIADILMAKAREGVKVRVIYDHVGSFHVQATSSSACVVREWRYTRFSAWHSRSSGLKSIGATTANSSSSTAKSAMLAA